MVEHSGCVLSSRLLGSSKSIAKCSDLFRDHVDRTTAAVRKWARTINAYAALVAVGVCLSVCLPSNVASSVENVTGSVLRIS